MKTYARRLAAGLAVLTLGIWFVAAGRGNATHAKAGVKAEVQKVADARKEGNAADAKKSAEDIAKSNELEEVMNLMALRKPNQKKEAIGFGETPSKRKPDGVEAKLTSARKR